MRSAGRPLLVGLALLLLAAPAGAMSLPPYGVEVSQQLFELDGNPSLVANFIPDGSLATPSWAVCPPGAAACTPSGVTNQVLTPGPTPAGTVFEASASYAGATYSARSAPWQGAVAVSASPTLTGAARVGAVVTPHAGSWSGGWGDEWDLVHVEACRTADGRGCTTIAHPWTVHGPRARVRIDPRWSGRWLFALDQRHARQTAFPAIGYLSPASTPRAPVGPTVARSAPLGPVTGPALALRAHPLLLRDGGLLLGRATCPRGCDVTLRVTAGDSDLGAGLRLRGTRRLIVPAPDVRLDGLLRIRVRLGDAPPVETLLQPHSVVAARQPARTAAAKRSAAPGAVAR